MKVTLLCRLLDIGISLKGMSGIPLYSLNERGTAAGFTDFVVGTSSLAVVGVFFWLPPLTLYIQRKLKSGYKRAMLVAMYILSIVLPMGRSKWLSHSSILREFLHYFKTRVVGVEALQSTQCVFGIFPHGVIPFSLGMTAFGPLCEDVFNNLRIVTASIGTY